MVEETMKNLKYVLIFQQETQLWETAFWETVFWETVLLGN